MESMQYIPRLLEQQIQNALRRNKSVLLLGPRQTGKSTLLGRLQSDLTIRFVQPDVRLRYEKNPATLTGEVEALSVKRSRSLPLVLLDEVQKVPKILDVVQDLVDRKRANFVLTGSSARKLRRSPETNLLPGRVVALRLDPLTFAEFPKHSLEGEILFGSLPGIVQLQNDQDREIDLASYVLTYLEEEVRAEALVRSLGTFARFLEYAASESGQIVNHRKLSQEIGVAHTTIASYYEILEDCLIAEKIEAFTKSRTRKKLTKSPKYLFFDLGVRRLCAKEGSALPRETQGMLFEQYVGLELLRYSRLSSSRWALRFWRDPEGPEVDWILEGKGQLIPVEAKMTNRPDARDCRHLRIFLDEYRAAERAYLVCTVPRRMQLEKNILAVPWQEIQQIAHE